MDDIYKSHFNESPDTIYELARLTGFSIDEFNEWVYAILNKDFKGNTIHSENTQYLGNNSLSDLLLPALIQLEDHSTRNDNPHNETTTSIGTMTVEEIEALDLGEGIRSGMYPLDVIGYDTRDWIPFPLNEWITYSADDLGTIVLTDDLPFSIYCTPYLIEPSRFIIKEQCPNWPNVDVYLYIGLNKGLPSITLSEVKTSDTIANLYMATVSRTTKTLSIMSPVIRFSGKRLSSTPVQDGLPVGPGPFMGTAKLNAGWLGGIGDSGPTRPPGEFDITFYSFLRPAGGKLWAYNGLDMYVSYTDGVAQVNTFTAGFSGNIASFSYTVDVLEGTRPTGAVVGVNYDSTALTFHLDNTDNTLCLLKFNVTIVDANSNTVTKSIYVRRARPLVINYLGTSMDVNLAAGVRSDRASLNAVMDIPYTITILSSGEDVTKSFSYVRTSGSTLHKATLSDNGAGVFGAKFVEPGGGTITYTFRDKYGTVSYFYAYIKVDSEGPPVYNPKFTGITATGQRVPVSVTPDVTWFNTYKNMGVDFMPFVEWEIEFQGIGVNYTYGADTQESLLAPGAFKGFTTKVAPNILKIQMIRDYSTPPAGKTVQYLKMAMILKNGIGQAVADHYYLRFIHNG